MQRVVDVGGFSYYVIYDMKGEEIIIHGIACAGHVVLYLSRTPRHFGKFEKILLNEATKLTLKCGHAKSLETVLIESLKKAHEITARTVIIR